MKKFYGGNFYVQIKDIYAIYNVVLLKQEDRIKFLESGIYDLVLSLTEENKPAEAYIKINNKELIDIFIKEDLVIDYDYIINLTEKELIKYLKKSLKKEFTLPDEITKLAKSDEQRFLMEIKYKNEIQEYFLSQIEDALNIRLIEIGGKNNESNRRK